jgi:ribosome biogenesis GTPase
MRGNISKENEIENYNNTSEIESNNGKYNEPILNKDGKIYMNEMKMNETPINKTIDMKDYGFNAFYEKAWLKLYESEWHMDSPSMPARIISDYGQKVRVITPFGEKLANRPAHGQEMVQMLAAGDWLSVHLINNDSEASIEHILPRMTKFSRAAAGVAVKEQIVAANVDTIFLIQSLNKDFNMRRLERYLIAAWESGAVPVIVLTKSDLCDDVDARIQKVEETAPGVEIHAVSNLTGSGIESLRKYVSTGKTIALLGSSGVGKSTLVNTLTGSQVLRTQEIREDDSKGRHTTTHRELVLLPGGGLILDTPGMRTLSLWEAEEGMEKMFGDIESIIKTCRFNDCKHEREPGCAVRDALRKGTIDMPKWQSWLKLQKEIRHLEAKKDNKIRAIEKLGVKKVSRQVNARTRQSEGYDI